MSATLGINLRVTCHGSRGDRKHMEDYFVLNYEPSEDMHKLEYAFFGIFDGHGGKEAAQFAKEHLMKFIVSDKRFWSNEDDDVLQAITNGFLQTHFAMWKDLVNWPKNSSGLPSTSGTTASIAFIRRGKIYIGHVGDSSIVLGYKKEGKGQWIGKALTKDHKPDDAQELARIRSCGGKVVSKSGCPRVVWNRPRLGHKGPVRRSTPIDEIPFLAVARSLGDLWSYNSDKDEFVVSPYPDVHVIEIDVESHRCLIFGTDGLWNMLSPEEGVRTVQEAELLNEQNVYSFGQPATAKNQMWVNPSKRLVDKALNRWSSFSCARADNTSAVTLMLDPPGVQRRVCDRTSASQPVLQATAYDCPNPDNGVLPSAPTVPLPNPTVAIFTRPSSSVAAPPTISVIQPLDHEYSRPLESGQECSESCLKSTSPLKHVGNVSDQQDHSSDVPILSSSDTLSPSCMADSEVPAQGSAVLTSSLSGPMEGSSHVESPLVEMKSNEEAFPAPDVDAGLSSSNINGNAAPLKFEALSMKPNKVLDSPRLQDPLHQLSESIQRLSNKRLRCKTVNGADTSQAFGVIKTNAPCDMGIVRRRHSSVLDSRTSSLAAGLVNQSLGDSASYGTGYQLGAKRRTRSEDKLLQAVGRLEDDLRTSDEENKRVGWPVNWINGLRPSGEGSQENSAVSSTRRKKKWIRRSGNAMGSVKQARPTVSMRSSSSFVNGCDSPLVRDCKSELNSSRVLRSDTHSGLSIHSLCSQNLGVKVSRLAIHPSTKFTSKTTVQLKAALELSSFAAASTTGLHPAAKLLLSSSGSSKRLRQSCGRTRSIGTRSRVKRLSK